MSVMRRFMAVLARWRRDSAGNIAVLAALGLIALLTLTGAAVDFGMSLYARQRLDAAVQSAAAAAPISCSMRKSQAYAMCEPSFP